MVHANVEFVKVILAINCCVSKYLHYLLFNECNVVRVMDLLALVGRLYYVFSHHTCHVFYVFVFSHNLIY